MSRTLICNIVPSELVHELNSPQAPNNFCFNLIDNNCFDTVYSIVPLSYSDRRIKSDKKVTYFFSKTKPNKIGIILYTLYSNLRCSLKAIKTDTVWFYNIVNSNVFCFLLLRYFFRKKVYVIMLDHTPTEKVFTIGYFVPYLIKKSHGIISLSSRTEISNPNMEYIAGIIPIQKIQKESIITNKKLKFLFSGVLAKHTGFDIAIEVFKQLPNCELYVSGLGELTNMEFDNYHNIHFLGYLSYEEYLKLYKTIDVCLSFRNPVLPENNNNFPSKILEYFSYNKIVISTISYPELIDFNYFSCKFRIEDIKKTIEEICVMRHSKLNEYKDNSSALKNNFSEVRWSDALLNIEING